MHFDFIPAFLRERPEFLALIKQLLKIAVMSALVIVMVDLECEPMWLPFVDSKKGGGLS